MAPREIPFEILEQIARRLDRITLLRLVSSSLFLHDTLRHPFFRRFWRDQCRKYIGGPLTASGKALDTYTARPSYRVPKWLSTRSSAAGDAQDETVDYYKLFVAADMVCVYCLGMPLDSVLGQDANAVVVKQGREETMSASERTRISGALRTCLSDHWRPLRDVICGYAALCRAPSFLKQCDQCGDAQYCAVCTRRMPLCVQSDGQLLGNDRAIGGGGGGGGGGGQSAEGTPTTLSRQSTESSLLNGQDGHADRRAILRARFPCLRDTTCPGCLVRSFERCRECGSSLERCAHCVLSCGFEGWFCGIACQMSAMRIGVHNDGHAVAGGGVVG